ncbi:ABC transporter ATP-binding protein [Saccharothrix algeriensis]|uniref:ABC transporter ATP-binding protein n=1 Tax=Saccharothrix algeriensis TaxID=173560 RepID=A0A8T8I0I6_9PSEU|nr:ABC transporter ATP-binding protein [Saccharothrix algeriensis]MBM7809950.1 ABC-type multidrug transport system fused ATPase/permease subunit [Saccharothrix algeriensis]QTR04191.1 ABC transporter ATP-binding protein [Saccharothrix algeriensis]
MTVVAPPEHAPGPTAVREEPERPRVGLRELFATTRGHRRSIALALALTLLGAGLGLVQPLVAMRTIETVTAGGVIGWLLALLAVMFVAEAVIDTFGRYWLERSGEGIVLSLRIRLVDRLLRLPMRAYDRHRLGDLLSRTTSDTTLLRDAIAYDLVDMFSGAFIVVGGLAAMVWLDPLLFLIVAVVVGGIGGVTLFVLSGIRNATESAQDNLGRMSAELERALTAIRTVRAMRAEDREKERIAECARVSYRQNLRSARLDSISGPAVTLSAHGSLIVVLVIGGTRVAHGHLTLAELVAFLLYVSYIAMPAAGLFEVAGTLQKGLAALQRVRDVTDLPVEADRPAPHRAAATATAPRPDDPARPALELRDVWFGYQPDRPVLRGVSFTVPHHGHVALVGGSGAGKSTIFALVERFYDPDRGVIRLDGRDLHDDLTIAQARALIGLVEQTSPVLHGTLRENVAYAVPDAPEEEIRRVLAMTNLTGMVDRLPDGLETQVGEHGSMISGGERQRLAIARALLPRPRLLLLDEPTAHLDAANEAAFARTIGQVATECALLVIAHRDTTVRLADTVVALDGGRVVAIGPFDEVEQRLPAFRDPSA